MGSLASINIKFFADLKSFSTEMQNAERQMKKMGESLENVGANMSMYVTAPILAMGAASLIAWDQSEKAIAQVNAGLKSTGGLVGYTTEQLQKMAAELQNNSLFDDDAILKDVTAQLLTFTNIAQEQFARTQQAALDLATRLDGDLKGASIQLGKALNDPIANLSALSRSGIQFSEDQKAMIKSLVETNRLADAQTLILDELERQYGGSAKAASEAGTGPLTQLGNILGNLSEDFGKMIGEAIMPFVAHLKEMALKLQALSPETKKVIGVVAALVAAIGPLTLALGFIMTTIIPMLIKGFTTMSAGITGVTTDFKTLTIWMAANPFTAIALVITAAAAALFLFAERANSAAAAQRRLNDAREDGAASAQSYEDVSNKNLQKGIDLINEKARAAIAETTNEKKIQDIKKQQLNETIALIEKEKKVINDRIVSYANQSAQYKADSPQKEKYNTLIKEESDFYSELTNRVRSLVTDKKELVKVEGAITDSVLRRKQAEVKGAYNLNIDKGTPKGKDAQWSNVSDFASAGSTINASLNTKPLVGFKDEVKGITEEIAIDFSNMAAGVATSMGEFVGALLSGTAGASDVGSFLLGTLGSVLTQLGQIAIQIGIGLKAIKTALKSLNPIVAIAAGVGLIALGAFFKNAASKTADSGGGGKTRAFASGGIAYGPTLGLVGEYAGAKSNPEVIAPLDRLKKLISPQGQNINIGLDGHFKMSGQDLLLVIERANNRKSRIG